MKKIIINGMRVIVDPQRINGKNGENGEAIVVRGVINTSQKVQGEWKDVPHYMSVFFTGGLKSRVEAMKLKKGSTLSVIGNYAVSVYQAEGKEPQLNISVFADSVEYSTGSIGSTGTLSVFCTDMGICTDIHQITSGGYVDAAYNTGYGDNKQTEYIRLLFTGATNALVQKGKRIDVIGKWDVNLVSKDGKTYINQTIYTGTYNKSPFTKRDSSAPAAASAPTAEAPHAAPAPAPSAPDPASSLSLEGFEEIGDNVAFF